MSMHNIYNSGENILLRLKTINNKNMKQLFTLFALGCTLSISAQTGSVTDIDNNTYKTKVYNNTEWMIENLKVTHYNNGDEILDGNLDDNNSGSIVDYEQYVGRMMHMENNSANTEIYGLLYNFNVTEDERMICPAGWEVPSYKDFLELADFIMGTEYADVDYRNSSGDLPKFKSFPEIGTKLKSKTTWAHNLEGTDEFEFNVLPTGFRNRYDGKNFQTVEYIQMYETARIWCKEHMRAGEGNARMSMVITNRDQPSDKGDYSSDNMEYNSSLMFIAGNHYSEGQNIRCIRKTNNTITALKNTDSVKLTVYPNPATSYILISGHDSGKGVLRVYNLSGSLVKDASFTFSENKIDISDLSAGVYICNIEAEGKPKETKKLIVK